MTLFIVYVIVATAGLIANAWCLYDAWKDVQAVRSYSFRGQRFWWKANPTTAKAAAVRIISLGSLRAEGVRLATQLFCLCLGILALQVLPIEPPDPTFMPGLYDAWPWVEAVRRGLFFVTFTLVLNSLLNVSERRRLFALGEVHDRNGVVRVSTDPAFGTGTVAEPNGSSGRSSDDVSDRASGE